MTHDEVSRLLDAYVDQELDPVLTAGIDRHLGECGICAEFVASRRGLRARLRASQIRFRMPPELTRWVGPEQRARYAAPGWMRAAAVAAVFLMAGFFLGQYTSRTDDLNAQFVNAHARSLLADGAVEVTSSDHHTVKPWFAQKLLFSPPVPELDDRGDRLLGGRADLIAKVRMAAMVYRHGNHLVNVFVWPEASVVGKPPGGDLNGFHVLGARIGGFNVALVSDMNPDELAVFRDRWVAQAKP